MKVAVSTEKYGNPSVGSGRLLLLPRAGRMIERG